MTYKKYLTLVQYITEVGDEQDKNRSCKYPFVAAEILSIQNAHTFKYFISSKPIVEQQVVIEEVQIEQQVDSDLSFVSSLSEGSIISDQSQAEKQSIDNQQAQNHGFQSLQDLNSAKNLSQINEDDFPFIEEVKKVKKVKQKIQKVINRQYQPLASKLLYYFNQPLNHTLAGYTCKVINALLFKNSSLYPQLLMKAQTTLFLNHIESRSTEELLVKILTFQSDSQTDVAYQYELIVRCMHKIFDDNDKLVVQNLSFMINEVFAKISQGQITSSHYKKLSKQILKRNFLQKLCEYFQQNVKQLQEFYSENDLQEIQISQLRIKQFAKIFSTFLDFFLKVKGMEEFAKDCKTIFFEYESHFNKFTEAAYKKLQFESHSLRTKNKNKIYKCGMTKILLIKILFTFIKQNLGFCQQILAEKHNFFQILLDLAEKSPLNSILHNSIFSIFDFFVQSLKINYKNPDRVIVGSLLKQAFDLESKHAFIHFCCKNLEQSKKASNIQKKGFIGHLIKICLQIHRLTASKDEEMIQKLKQTTSWGYIIKQHIQPYLKKTNLNLGNHIKQSLVKAPIQFDKSAILLKHKQFLKGTKFTTLEDFDNFEPGQSDSEEEKTHQVPKISIKKETQHQVEEIELEEFQLNTGIKKNVNQ